MPYKLVGTLNVYDCRCVRCGHEWTASGAGPPGACAGCKSRYWDVARGALPLGRPPKKKRRTRRG